MKTRPSIPGAARTSRTFWILRRTFPDVKTIRLEQNYRSTQMILEGAGAVVAQNTQRKGKNLWTAREGGSADWILRGSGWRE